MALKGYLTNPISSLPHHWVLGLAVILVGLLSFVVPGGVSTMLVAGGVVIVLHDLLYHKKHGWARELKFR